MGRDESKRRGPLPLELNPLKVDPRLHHNGTERDTIAEAIVCAIAHTKDVDGKVMRTAMNVNEMIQTARAIATHLERYGYKIVKVTK